MQFFFETISVVVLSLGAFLLAFLIILNLYLIKRNGFYVRVNCWFCNSWTKVLYNDRNSFNCPSCTQYNGFLEDGSYNKTIEAQHNVSLTKYSTQKTEYYENGLCNYCNNNQQLKMHQVAKFTPINEDNYDLEIEHFKKQLEKAYKLCKKCEKVLKKTLNTQHSWIFGNRLKDLRRKGFSLLDPTKTSKQEVKKSTLFRFLRYTLIAFTIFILCHVLNIRIIIPYANPSKYLPKVFTPYKTIFIDFYQKVVETLKRMVTEIEHINVPLQKHIIIHTSKLTLVTCGGFILDLILSVGERRPLIWKINGIFGWIMLVTTSSMSFSNTFATYVSGIQVFTLLVLLYNYIWSLPTDQKITKECQFKKITKVKESSESSEEETDEDISQAFNVTSKTSRSHRAYSPLKQSINNSFTANNVTSTSKMCNLSNSSNDLNHSLDNLHLSFNSQCCTSPIFSVNSTKRPILSPAKLKNITQNPWTAGGFWKNDVNVHSASVNLSNLSRSSSQSSGFVSNHAQDMNNPFNSLPVSREPSISGDIDRISIFSEPAYHFSPISPTSSSVKHPKSPQLYYKADNNTFYPVLSQNNMLFIQNGIPQQTFKNNSLKNINSIFNCQTSLKNFDNKSNCNASYRSFQNSRVGVISPSLFSEKPTYGLLKKYYMDENFKKPQC